ncbi:MAG: YceI family protein [Acidobacteriota bacterium]|nr:YceI family protein [Acidobacteriota bacterium]
MKRVSFLIGILLIGLFIVSNFVTTAGNLSIAEKYAAGDKLTAEEQTGIYGFDKAHSTIGFRAKHYGLVEVPGYFRDFTGTVKFDGKDVAKSTVEFAAKMESVDTGVAGRDKHLKNADFFEVEKYPEMTFKSTKVEKKGKNWMVTGDLMMKGVTKQIMFPITVAGFVKTERGPKMGATAETTINRRDFGVNYDSKLPGGTAAVSDEIKVILNIEGNMQKAAQ